MDNFIDIQKKLDELIQIPINIPKVYIFGDTAAGKTTIIRQLLGTKEYNFPTTRLNRCTVAQTEYVITKDELFRAALLFKTRYEISTIIQEILEKTILESYKPFVNNETNIEEISELLEESADQRFRLKYIINDEERSNFAKIIYEDILPKIKTWILTEFPDEDDLNILLELAIDEVIKNNLIDIQENIITKIEDELIALSDKKIEDGSYYFEDNNIDNFISKLKKFLAAEKNSISPIIHKARIRGPFFPDWIKNNVEIVLIDGEGIGHDTKETKNVLDSRHLDYFYISDSIVLVENSTKPFTSGGKVAIKGVIQNGFVSKFKILFNQLDKVEPENNRKEQIKEVKKALRNVINSIVSEKINISQSELDLFFVGNPTNFESTEENIFEYEKLLKNIKETSLLPKPQFVTPVYDLEMLAPFINEANIDFRNLWENYLFGNNKKPWQTVKAFNRRMEWGQDGYFEILRPVAELHNEIISELSQYLNSPIHWKEEVTTEVKKASINLFKQSFSNLLLNEIRKLLVLNNLNYWKEALEFSGYGSTIKRANKIDEIVKETVPSMLEVNAVVFKDIIKDCINKAISNCAKPKT